MTEWSEGVCGDGAVILRDGVPVSISDLLALLAHHHTALAERDKARAAWRSLLERHAEICAEYGMARDELTMLRA